MAEEQPTHVQGPVMLVATNMMRPPPARIGQITKDITLPRTVSVKSAVGGLVGLAFGLAVGAFFGSMQGFVVCATLGMLAGVAVVNWSPIQGESFLTWMGLAASSARANRVQINGLNARVYIGIAPLTRTALGSVNVKSGAVEVGAGTVDERGVIISSSQKLQERRNHAAEFANSRGIRWNDVEKKSLPQQRQGALGDKKKAAPTTRRELRAQEARTVNSRPQQPSDNTPQPSQRQQMHPQPQTQSQRPAARPLPSQQTRKGAKSLPSSKSKPLNKR